jgi:hypothetical protein
MQRFLNILKTWLPLAVVILGLGGLAYLLVQQTMRQGLNDPQVQMAEDGAAALAAGVDPASLVPAAPVEVDQSLAPFLIVYDDAGNVLAASARLHGATPPLPEGVLNTTRSNGEDRVTWQPETGVRIAAVVARYEGSQPGFVLAGRNMREVERRIDQVGQFTILALAATLVFSLAVVILGELVVKRR